MDERRAQKRRGWAEPSATSSSTTGMESPSIAPPSRSSAITCGPADTKSLSEALQPFLASGDGCARLWLGMTKPVELHKTTGSTHVRVRSPAIATHPKPADLVVRCFGLTDFNFARRKQGSRARHAVHAATLQARASDLLFQFLPYSPIESPISPSMDSRALIARDGRPILI